MNHEVTRETDSCSTYLKAASKQVPVGNDVCKSWFPAFSARSPPHEAGGMSRNRPLPGGLCCVM